MDKMIIRCPYCGSSDYDGFCPGCEDKMVELIGVNAKKGLCSCGKPLYADAKGKDYPICIECLKRNNAMCKSIRDQFTQLKKL